MEIYNAAFDSALSTLLSQVEEKYRDDVRPTLRHQLGNVFHEQMTADNLVGAFKAFYGEVLPRPSWRS